MGANNSQTRLGQILKALTNDGTAFASQDLTLVNTTVQSLTVPAGTKYALVYLSGNTANYIRYWLDGSTPSNTSGIKRLGETAFDISGADDIANFKCYTSGTGMQLSVQYYR
jgi:hypothetical protein